MENSYFNTNSSPTEVFIKLLYTPSHLRVCMRKNMENLIIHFQNRFRFEKQASSLTKCMSLVSHGSSKR